MGKFAGFCLLRLFLLSVLSYPMFCSIISDDLMRNYWTKVEKKTSIFTLDAHDRSKRAAATTTSSPHRDGKIIDTEKVTVVALNDSHPVLNVHWVGAGSKVIIALSLVPEMSLNSDLSSKIYFSYDYGKTFVEKQNSSIRALNGGPAYISAFTNSPARKTYFIFADTKHNLTFTTTDSGQSFFRSATPFCPRLVKFYPAIPRWILAQDKHDPRRRLWLSTDLGATWRPVQEDAHTFLWGVEPYDERGTVYVVRGPEGSRTVVRSSDGFQTIHQVVRSCKVFSLSDQYMFYTTQQRAGSLDLYVSYDRDDFRKAEFPDKAPRQSVLVTDTSEGQLLVAVRHNRSLSRLYVSEHAGHRFSVSLDNIIFISNTTADLQAVKGVRGFYVASVLQHAISPLTGWRHQTTMVTADKGALWRPLDVSDPCPSAASGETSPRRCAVHLAQGSWARLMPGIVAPMMSRPSAPGILMANGVTGPYVHDTTQTPDLFVSDNGGFNWTLALKGRHMFNMGDHGGLLVAVPFGMTHTLLYSWDMGATWEEVVFSEHSVRVYGLLTEPGEATTTFSIFASDPTPHSPHSWLVMQIDLGKIFHKNCTKSDYREWDPIDTVPYSAEFGRLCLLGRRTRIERRSRYSECYNGRQYVRTNTTRICPCAREDFECDFGYEVRNSVTGGRHNLTCVRDPSAPVALIHCDPDYNYYNRTKGYRKIAGDTCQGGDEVRYSADKVPCRVPELPEFLMYASGSDVKLLDVGSNDVRNVRVTTLGGGVVTSLAFDYGNNCLFYRDTHKIMRQCLKGYTAAQTVIEGRIDPSPFASLAYDWGSGNIYWISNHSIEMARSDGLWRRVVVRGPELTPRRLLSPAHLLVLPDLGMMYWVDTGSRGSTGVFGARMDGVAMDDGKVVKAVVTAGALITKPTGLAYDFQTEQLYWLDITLSHIGVCDVDGSNPRVLVSSAQHYIRDAGLLAVFKNSVYWFDYGRGALMVADKYSGRAVRTYSQLGNMLPPVDLRAVQKSALTGKTACSVEHGCHFLCAERPDSAGKTKRSCLCPDIIRLTRQQQVGGSEDCSCPTGEKLVNSTCVLSGPNSTCPSNTFTCDDKHCVPSSWRCDHDNDCGDGSDERGCDYDKCAAGEFKCGSGGRCLPIRWRCDFDVDCPDGSDEMHCNFQNRTCAASEFRCSNGQCIHGSFKCDRDPDCRDSSDEHNCSFAHSNHSCPASFQFPCHNGVCSLSMWRCDGKDDCGDFSDEIGCHRNSSYCTAGRNFTCGDGECVAQQQVCDGHVDCNSAVDEINCTRTTPTWPTTTRGLGGFNCLSYETPCDPSKPNTTRCYSEWDRCDGILDCPGAEDETHCGKSTPRPTAGTTPGVQSCELDNKWECWRSPETRCVWRSWVCDGQKDCPHGEDELHCNGTATQCGADQVKCRTSAGCAWTKDVCDGVEDCADGSDEENCGSTTFPPVTQHPGMCPAGEIPCPGGHGCISPVFMCDGSQQCPGGRDEDPVLCGKKAPVVTSLTLTFASDTTAEFVWEKPEGENLTYIPTIREPNQWYNETTTKNLHYTITGLIPYTSYSVGVYCRSEISSLVGPLRKTVVFRTLQAAPEAPRQVHVFLTASSTVSVTWKTPQHANGVIMGYYVYYSTTPNSHFPNRKKVRSDDLKATVPSRIGNVLYVSVAAFNVREGPKSAEQKVIVTPNPDIPQAVTHIQVSDIKEQSAAVTWQYSKKSHSFNITVVRGEQERFFTTRQTSYTLRGLAPGTPYEVVVKAVSQHSGGPPQSAFFTTIGKKRSDVRNLRVDLTSNTEAHLTWAYSAEKGEHTVFEVCYGDERTWNNVDETCTSAQTRRTASTTELHVASLSLCTTYVFSVKLISPYNSSAPAFPVRLETGTDPKAPPTLNTVTTSQSNMTITWSPSCSSFSAYSGITYMVKIELLRFLRPPFTPATIDNSTVIRTIQRGPPRSSLTQQTFTVHGLNRSAPYRVWVKTNVVGSTWSYNQTVVQDPYPPPRGFRVDDREGDSTSVNLTWAPPAQAPKDPKYVVWLGTTCDLLAKVQETSKTHVQLTGVLLKYDTRYCVTVSLSLSSGYYGKLARAYYLDIGKPAGFQDTRPQLLTQTNLAAILVPVLFVVVVLVVVLAVYVIRHRRLQRSFLNFATSRYDARSGSSTLFTDTPDLDTDDTPTIQGFSDDEPLVLA